MGLGVLLRTCLFIAAQFGASLVAYVGMQLLGLPDDTNAVAGITFGCLYTAVALVFMCDRFIVTHWRWEAILGFGMLLATCLGACLGALLNAPTLGLAARTVGVLVCIALGVFGLIAHPKIRGWVHRISRKAVFCYGIILFIAFCYMLWRCTAGNFGDRIIWFKLAPDGTANYTIFKYATDNIRDARPVVTKKDMAVCDAADATLVAASVIFYVLMIAWDLDCMLTALDEARVKDANVLAATVSVSICVDFIMVVANMLHLRRPRARS